MKKNIYLFLLGLITPLFFIGQTINNDYIPNLNAPPSPDASALGKYGQYPTTLNNGLVNISIPIYTINLPLVSIPISISYHSAGIKVNDISSTVGLGWSLNGGGVITRSVKGIPDKNFGKEGASKLLGVDDVNKMNNEYSKITYLWNIYDWEKKGEIDTESDVYHFNFAGNSGSFRYTTDGKIIQIPLSNNKIVYNSVSDYFEITGSDGTVYLFTQIEKSWIDPWIDITKYTSSWYLTKITTIDNKIISFEYLEDTTAYYDYYQSYSLKIGSKNAADAMNYKFSVSFIVTRTENTKLLKSIFFPGGSVKFSYQNNRADRRKYRLVEIGIQDEKNRLVKAFGLKQSYFGDSQCTDADNMQSDQNYSTHYDLRLKLDKLVLLDSNRSKISSYDFGYNTSIGLPHYVKKYEASVSNSRNFGQDLWGYYNGVTTNTHLFTYFPDNRHYYIPVEKADRSVNAYYTQACILNQIKYPTGGFTKFEYEGNGPEIGGLRIKNIISYPTDGAVPNVRSYQYFIPFTSRNIVMDHAYKEYTQAIFYNEGYYDVSDYYSSEPALPLTFTDGSPVSYTKVAEYDGYPEDNNGKTEHFFRYAGGDLSYFLKQNHFNLPSTDFGITFFQPRYTYAYLDLGWRRGQKTREDIYKKENGEYKLIKSSIYTYEDLDNVETRVGFKSFATLGRNLQTPTVSADDLFQTLDIIARTGIVKLTKVEEIDYLQSNSVTNTTTYKYDRITYGFNHFPISQYEKPNGPSQLYEVTATIKTNSDGTIEKKYHKYPYDYSDEFVGYMIQRNLLTKIMSETDSVNNRFAQEVVNEYKKILDDIIVLDKINIRKGNGISQPEIIFSNYDDKGNLLGAIKKDNTNECIIWGYNKTLPVARLSNISYDSVNNNSNLISNINKLQNFETLDDETTRNNLILLNRSIRENLPVGVHIVTCTYQPLIGITSLTDTSGKTTYYKYDSTGKLAETYLIEDGIKKILQNYEYHYGVN